MRDILDRVVGWVGQGQQVALATIVEVVRKAPRDAGTAMAVSRDGQVAGSVSGGCVEPAVVEVAEQVLADGVPRMASFGISDEDAFEVGLSCGGAIHVWVEPLGDEALPWLQALQRGLQEGRPLALVHLLEPERAVPGQGPGAAGGPANGAGSFSLRAHEPVPAGPDGAGRVLLLEEGVPGEGARPVVGTSGDPEVDAQLAARAGQLLTKGQNGREQVAGRDVFIHVFTPPPVLYIIGAVHPAPALAEAGRFLGYRVVVCDPRSPFATPERIPAAHQIVRQWPDEYLNSVTLTPRDAVCVLTHDLKFDVPALMAALASPVGYIGVMGSRRTHQRRLEALRREGVEEGALQRLHAPIGLDIGARTPEELAVSIVAELVACRNGVSEVRSMAAR